MVWKGSACGTGESMRIAVIETAPFGGLLHYAVQLGDALAERGHAVDLIVPARNELTGRRGAARRWEVLPAGPAPPAGANRRRVALLARRARTAAWRMATWARIVGAARRERYDVVILNGSIDLALTALAAFALLALSGRTRVTHVCHNIRPFNRWAGSELFVTSRPMLALLRRLYPAFDLVFVHGDRSRAEFEQQWPGARLAVVPHGDERVFADEPPPPAAEPRALFFGDWRRVKGLPVLMAAFEELTERMPEARLTIAGTPAPEEGDVETILAWAAARSEQVEVDPRYVPLDEVPGLFGRARVVVLPYLVGYQSGVLHLAMTMERAVVAADVGDLGAVVREGETGRVVPPGDPVALAAAMEEILRDRELASRLGAAGRVRVVSDSGWPRVAERVETALRSATPYRRRA